MAAAAMSLATAGLGAQSAAADRPRDAQWYLKTLRVKEAHELSKGAGVTVAVVDTGVMADHPDLRNAVLNGSNVLGNGGDGRSDPDGHGTQMAGIIAGRGHGADKGVLGIAPESKILPVRPASGPLLAGQCIDWAARHGAKVISMSFAISGSDGLAASVQAAEAADIVLIAGAGNEGEEPAGSRYPAGYPGVLAVGAVDRNGKVAGFSTRASYVGIAAPGTDIAVADGHVASGYGLVDGTSPATAIVAGAAALVRARYPYLSARQVVERLTSTAVDKGPPGRDDGYGFGELDLMAALTAPAARASSPPSEPARAPIAAEHRSAAGLPPLAFAGIGLVLLGAVILVAWRSRRA